MSFREIEFKFSQSNESLYLQTKLQFLDAISVQKSSVSGSLKFVWMNFSIVSNPNCIPCALFSLPYFMHREAFLVSIICSITPVAVRKFSKQGINLPLFSLSKWTGFKCDLTTSSLCFKNIISSLINTQWGRNAQVIHARQGLKYQKYHRKIRKEGEKRKNTNFLRIVRLFWKKNVDVHGFL